VSISWADFWIWLKPAPSLDDLGHVMARRLDAALQAGTAPPLLEVLDQNSARAEWLAELRKTLEKIVREIAEVSSRGAQARRCRQHLLLRIETNVSYEAVLNLDHDLRNKWLAFKSREQPFNEEKQMNLLLVKIAFGKLALAALQGFYISQYNASLNLQQFALPYHLVCAAVMEFKAKTFHILSGESVFRHQGAMIYDEFDVAINGTQLSQAKKALATAVQSGNKSDIHDTRIEATAAIRRCMIALDKFHVAGGRPEQPRQRRAR